MGAAVVGQYQLQVGGMTGLQFNEQGQFSVNGQRPNANYFTVDGVSAKAGEKGAQAAFLLEPTPIEDMARIAFAGGVMPQKSTDFYPKLLSGVTIYKL